MNIFAGLLFQHGYITDVTLAKSLAGAETTPAQHARQAKRVRRLARKRKHMICRFIALLPSRWVGK